MIKMIEKFKSICCKVEIITGSQEYEDLPVYYCSKCKKAQ